ncbi:PPK2 family polyphosphate kinase [uncultured Algimonas sp.]|uniref:PPK2 family polyphosphate kinase n=1 Tax=uncultured Algimonas sp. TaxID=1547920 RepID=UPI002633E30A|nr:PPK2 family polyphosphate kinase [uncultured Algimonas sp.]
MPHPDSPFLAVPGQPFDLSDRPTAMDAFESRSEAKAVARSCGEDIAELAHKLYALSEPKLLIVLQGIDTAGKNGTTKALFRQTPPLNVRVAPFKAPTKPELAHDFLWRVHKVVPGQGEIAVFNRSHYEDVLVVKVREIADAETVEQRYGQINDFERLLAETGTTILKFMLHISRDVQGERLRARLEDPGKRWKFNPGDLDDRALWDDYMDAYETMVRRTSTEHAPWYVIPSDDKKTRNALIAQIVHQALEDMDLHYPDPGYRPDDYDI